jgi:hypothetical protein
MMLAIAPLPAGSLAVLGKEALLHVNDPHVHVVDRVRLLGRVHDVSFVELLHLGRVPGTLVVAAGILHVSVVGVDDGLGKVNQ